MRIAVVGGGPVGMLVAAELAAYGVDTVVLEKRADISERPKATTLHARAVQCLVRRGYLAGLLGPKAPGTESADFHFAGMPGLVITVPDTEPAPILKIRQAELERHFEESARAAGARVLRNHRVTGIVQGTDGVRFTAEGPEGSSTYEVDFLVGADGAHSMVREQAGFAFDTHPATVSALTGLVRLKHPGTLQGGWLRTPRGWIVARHDPDGGTHLRTLNCAGAHENRDLPLSVEELRREVSWIAGHDIAMEEPRWLSRFNDFTRLVRNFRSGRIFLVGDAAHVHFPIGGQGLSAGVLDALNLGWKLALAVHGRAAPGLLDTYDLERRPAAQRVIDNTRAQLALMRPVVEADALRTVLGGVLAADGGSGYLRDLISAQDTVHPGHTERPSPWEGTFLHNMPLTTGTGRSEVIELLRDGRFLLLLFGEGGSRFQEEAREWAGIIRVVQLLPTPPRPYDALLVRPDGYIAWAPGGGALSDALSVHFTRGSRPAAAAAAAPGGGYGARLS